MQALQATELRRKVERYRRIALRMMDEQAVEALHKLADHDEAMAEQLETLQRAAPPTKLTPVADGGRTA